MYNIGSDKANIVISVTGGTFRYGRDTEVKCRCVSKAELPADGMPICMGKWNAFTQTTLNPYAPNIYTCRPHFI